MSHRRAVTESELEWSLRVITDEYVASTYTMNEDEYLLETVDPRAQKLTPHQVVRLIDHSNISEAVWEDSAVRRSFRRMAKVMQVRKVETEHAFQEAIQRARLEERLAKCDDEAERKEYRENITVAKLRCRAADALILSRDEQLVRYVRGAEALVRELISREMSDDSDHCDGNPLGGSRKVYVSKTLILQTYYRQ